MAVFSRWCNREPRCDVARDGPKRVQAPHAVAQRGIRSSVGMQLDATARTPSIAQAKSRACGNLDIAQTAYVGVARCFGTPVINERHLKPHSPVLLVADVPAP